MKNLKKVLALVLAFACAFTMFAGAVVYPDVPAGSEYSEAITMLSDLGIIQGKDDGKYHSEDTITRAEACALIARMLTGDPQVSQYAGASNFTDVVKGSWKESVVGYCVVNGITVGVGNNKFEPDRAITDAEFVTMVVRAMGYETTGTSYPYGHISAAQANGLLDDVTVVPSSAALRGEDAQIIYNALFADYARGAKRVNTTHGTTVEEYPTIAEDVFGLERAAVGTFDKDGNLKTCKAHNWVIIGQSCKAGDVNTLLAYPIEDGDTDIYALEAKKDGAYKFEYEGDIDSLVGYEVELWGEGQHSEPEWNKADETYTYAKDWDIKAIKTVKGQTAYAYNPSEDLPDVDFDDVKLFDLDNPTKIAKKDDVKDALKVKNSAKYNLVDWDSDGDVDYVDESITYYYEVSYVTSKKVELLDFNGDKAYTLDKDGSTDVTINKVDWTIKCDIPEDLEKDDIVAVTKDCVPTKKDAVSNWTMEVVEPETKEVTEVSTKKGVYFDDELISVADKGYAFAGTHDKYKALNEDKDTDYDLYRDANGFIIKLDDADEAYTGYIFVTGIKEGENKTGSRNLMEVSGRLDTNEKAEDVKITKDAKAYISYTDSTGDIKLANAIKNNMFTEITKTDNTTINPDEESFIGRAFKYKMNDDEQITKLEEVAYKTPAADYYFKAETDAVYGIGTGDYKQKNYLDKADVIFAVETSDGDEWDNQKFSGGLDTNFDGAEEDLDVKNVIAVKVDDIPDIGKYADTTAKTKSTGARYDIDTTKDRLDAAILGVDDLKYFNNTKTNVALVTEMVYHSKTETYTVKGVFAGSEETSFETIDKEDVEINGSTKLDELEKIIETGNGAGTAAKYGVYCEVEVQDGKIVALTPMDQTSANIMVDKIQNNPAYAVARGVVTNVSSSDYLTIHFAVADADGKKLATVENAEANWDKDLELKSDTSYYMITEDVKLTKNGRLNAYRDGFDEDLDLEDSFEEGNKSDLTSWIERNVRHDSYCVADVIYDIENDDVLAVFYYEDAIEETVPNVFTAVTANSTTPNKVDVTVTATAADIRGNVTVELKKGNTVVDSKTVTADATMNVTFTNVAADEYKVVASAVNNIDREEDTKEATVTVSDPAPVPAPTTVEILGVTTPNKVTVKATNVPDNATWNVKWDGAYEKTATAAKIDTDLYILTVPGYDFNTVVSSGTHTVTVSVNNESNSYSKEF